MSPWEHTWWLEPRDPMVFGSGARTPAFLPSFSAWLPPQATAAGMVRSTLAGGGTAVSPEDAAALLGVKIRGPWLWERCEDGMRLWVRVPVDTAVVGERENARLLRGRLEPLRSGEGVSRPRRGAPLPPLLTFLPSRHGGEKTRSAKFPYRPLDWLIGWLLSDEEEARWNLAEILASAGQSGEGTKREKRRRPIERESRVHVGIDDHALTAEPEALFSSAGLRFGDRFGLALEVTDGRPGVSAAQPPGLLLLGGEARVSRVWVTEGACFPEFGAWRAAFKKRIAALEGRRERGGGALGLRLQLLTPASVGGWQPERWPAALAGLPLAAAAVPGFDAVSGWDLQQRRPRAVRRLVPAGSVYTFGPVASKETLLELCETLWGTSLCAGLPGVPDRFLAPPENDGYGTVLPLPCALPKETKKEITPS